jgi:hypothetical protein
MRRAAIANLPQSSRAQYCELRQPGDPWTLRAHFSKGAAGTAPGH